MPKPIPITYNAYNQHFELPANPPEMEDPTIMAGSNYAVLEVCVADLVRGAGNAQFFYLAV